MRIAAAMLEGKENQMAKWEYKILSSEDLKTRGFLGYVKIERVEEYLNELGFDGWEVVNLDFFENLPHGAFLGVAKREVR